MSVGLETVGFKSPIRKLVHFFRRSRDSWKEKHHALKREFRKLTKQVAAVEKSREHGRLQAQESRRRVRELEQERMRHKGHLPLPVPSQRQFPAIRCGSNAQAITATVTR